MPTAVPAQHDVRAQPLPFHACPDTPPPSVYAVRALLNALAPLIGAEADLSGAAVAKGWAAEATPEQIKAWAQAAQDRLRDEVDRVVQSTAAAEYARLMHKVRLPPPYPRINHLLHSA